MSIKSTSLNFKSTNNQFGGFSSSQAQAQALKDAIAKSQQQNPEAWKKNTQKQIQPSIKIDEPRQQQDPIKLQSPPDKINQQIKPVQNFSQIKPVQPSRRYNINQLPSEKITTIHESLTNYWSGINPYSKETQAKYTSRSGEVEIGPSALETALIVAPGGQLAGQVGKVVIKNVAEKEIPSVIKGITAGVKKSTDVKVSNPAIAVVSKDKNKIKNVVMQEGTDSAVITLSGKTPIKNTGNVVKKTEQYITGARFGQKIIGKKPINVQTQTLQQQTTVTDNQLQGISKSNLVQKQQINQLNEIETFYSFQQEGKQGPWFSKELYPSYAANISLRNPNIGIDIWELKIPKTIADKYNAKTLSQPFREGRQGSFEANRPLGEYDPKIKSTVQKRDLLTGKMMEINPNNPVGKYVYERTHFKPLSVANEWVFPISVVNQFGRKVANSKDPTKFINTIKKSGSTENKIKRAVPRTQSGQQTLAKGSSWGNVLKTANKKTRLLDKRSKKGGVLPVKNTKALEEMKTFYSIQTEGHLGPWFSERPDGFYPTKIDWNGFFNDGKTPYSDMYEITVPKSIADKYLAKNLASGYIESPESQIWRTKYIGQKTPEGKKPRSDYETTHELLENEPMGERVANDSLLLGHEWAFPKEIVKKYSKKISNSREPRKFIESFNKGGVTNEQLYKRIAGLDSIINYNEILLNPKSTIKPIMNILQKRNRLQDNSIAQGVSTGSPPKKLPMLPNKLTPFYRPIKKTYPSEGVSDNLIIRIGNNTRKQLPKMLSLNPNFNSEKLPLKKVISGGQDGVDATALESAKKLGLETGGEMPLGGLTESGKNLNRLKEFGMTESNSASYPVRTKTNVVQSDATVVFGDVNSPGTKLTINLARQNNRPLLINPKDSNELEIFIKNNNVKTLNIAGSRASKDIGGQTSKKVSNILGSLVKKDNYKLQSNMYNMTPLDNIEYKFSEAYYKLDETLFPVVQPVVKTIKNVVSSKSKKLLSKEIESQLEIAGNIRNINKSMIDKYVDKYPNSSALEIIKMMTKEFDNIDLRATSDYSFNSNKLISNPYSIDTFNRSTDLVNHKNLGVIQDISHTSGIKTAFFKKHFKDPTFIVGVEKLKTREIFPNNKYWNELTTNEKEHYSKVVDSIKIKPLGVTNLKPNKYITKTGKKVYEKPIDHSNWKYGSNKFSHIVRKTKFDAKRVINQKILNKSIGSDIRLSTWNEPYDFPTGWVDPLNPNRIHLNKHFKYINEKGVANVINHEVNHSIITKIAGDNASSQFDNLAYATQKGEKGIRKIGIQNVKFGDIYPAKEAFDLNDRHFAEMVNLQSITQEKIIEQQNKKLDRILSTTIGVGIPTLGVLSVDILSSNKNTNVTQNKNKILSNRVNKRKILSNRVNKNKILSNRVNNRKLYK